MVMLGALKGKLNEDMAAPEMEVEVEAGEGEGEEMAESKPIDLAGVSDDELMAEVAKRGLA